MTIPVINSPVDALLWLRDVYDRRTPALSMEDTRAVLERGLTVPPAPPPPLQQPWAPTGAWGVPDSVSHAFVMLQVPARAHGSLNGEWVNAIATRGLALLREPAPVGPSIAALQEAGHLPAPDRPTYQELADALTNVMAGHAHCYPAARELVKQLQQVPA